MIVYVYNMIGRGDRFIRYRHRHFTFRVVSTNVLDAEEDVLIRHTNFFRRKNNRIGTLILLRHGQSQWNVTDSTLGTTARFTGWTDIPLTQRGIQQAIAAGKSLKQFFQQVTQSDDSHHTSTTTVTKNIPLDAAFCSLLNRSRDTLTLCLQQLDMVVGYQPSDTILAPTIATARTSHNLLPSLTTILPSSSSPSPHSPTTVPANKTAIESTLKYKIPIISSWRLNERHYGALVGLSKEGAERLYGKTQLKQWRDGWEVAPPPMESRQWNKWKNLVHTQAVTVVRDPGIGFGEEDEIDVPASSLTVRDSMNTDKKESPSLTSQIQGVDPDSTHPRMLHGTADSTINTFPSPREFTVYEYRTSKSTSLSSSSSIPTNMPSTESLSDTCKRILPIWNSGIAPRLREGQTIILVAHANTIRCLLYHIDPDIVSQETMKQVKIPSAVPLVYTFRSSCSSSQTPLEYDDLQNNNEQPLNESFQNNQNMYTEIPGNLLLIRRPKKMTEKEGYDESIAEDLGKQLNGIWLHSDELKSLSFCSKLGIKHLEHEIA